MILSYVSALANKVITIGSHSFVIPTFFKFVTVNKNGRMELWESEPIFTNGFWYGTNESGYIYAIFIMEDGEFDITKSIPVLS